MAELCPQHEEAWQVLYTRHQHETSVARSLSRKGFEIFLPTYESVRLWKDRRKLLTLPLFPCYVFIRGVLERSLDVVTTPGVWYVVVANGGPAHIHPAEMEQIRLATTNAPRIEPHPFLTSGDRVRIKAGPLEGVEGILVRHKAGHRLVLSLHQLGQSAALEVDIALVERIPDTGSHPMLHGASARPALNQPNASWPARR